MEEGRFGPSLLVPHPHSPFPGIGGLLVKSLDHQFDPERRLDRTDQTSEQEDFPVVETPAECRAVVFLQYFPIAQDAVGEDVGRFGVPSLAAPHFAPQPGEKGPVGQVENLVAVSEAFEQPDDLQPRADQGLRFDAAVEQAPRHEPVVVGRVAERDDVGDVGTILDREDLVLGVVERFVEAQLEAFDRRPGEHLVPGPAETAVAQQVRNDRHAVVVPGHDPAVAHGIDTGAGRFAASGALLEEIREGDAVLADSALGELLQVLGNDPVVGVHEHHEFAPGLVEPQVPCCTDSAVGAVEDPDAPVLCRVAVADRLAVVRAAVVDEQQFEVRHGLSQNALDAGRQVLFRVEDRDDDRNKHGVAGVVSVFGWQRVGSRLREMAVEPFFASGAMRAEALQIALLIDLAVVACGFAVVEVEGDSLEFDPPLPDPAVTQPEPEFGILESPPFESFVEAVDPDQVIAPDAHVAASGVVLGGQRTVQACGKGVAHGIAPAGDPLAPGRQCTAGVVAVEELLGPGG